MTQYEYQVTGRGRFPVDMLRYDRCWPVDNIGLITGGYEERSSETYTVKIRSDKAPTVGRWNSFCWGVFDLNGRGWVG